MANRLKAKGEGAAEDKMVKKHHLLNGLEFEQILVESEGRGSLACCSVWGHKESDTTQQQQTQL